jgi:hypothetical protein
VLFPGPVPGAVALGIYNFGILGRLMAEVVENLDPAPGAALRALGASPASVFGYATLPLSVARFASYSLYRWEVAVRETVVVGVVGAGGLGRLLEQQRAAFNYRGIAGHGDRSRCRVRRGRPHQRLGPSFPALTGCTAASCDCPLRPGAVSVDAERPTPPGPPARNARAEGTARSSITTNCT